MLIFFDYLYYGARKIYIKYESGAGFSAIAVITITQTLNILIVYFLYQILTETRVGISKLAALAIYFSVLILNVIRYSKLDPELIKEKWENKSDKQKITYRAFLVIYVFLSFALPIGLAIYNSE